MARARVDGRELAAIFAGGFIGAIARVALADAWPARAAHWPWATFVANIAGALALGCFAAALHDRTPVPSYRLRFLGTGFCGALTTFSTMQLELLRMLDAGDDALAASYALASIVAGLAVVALGTAVVRRVRARAVTA
ncbi:MAG TPA: fluoride efflux transporter CrcB [Solirubrobacteraceae bacterium]